MDPVYKGKLLRKVLLDLKESYLLVEGKKDVAALGKLGISGNVLAANGRNERVVERALANSGGTKIVLLFDFDGEGERKTEFFRELFFHSGHSPDTGLRKKVKMLFGITTIEELPAAYSELLERLQQP